MDLSNSRVSENVLDIRFLNEFDRGLAEGSILVDGEEKRGGITQLIAESGVDVPMGVQSMDAGHMRDVLSSVESIEITGAFELSPSSPFETVGEFARNLSEFGAVEIVRDPISQQIEKNGITLSDEVKKRVEEVDTTCFAIKDGMPERAPCQPERGGGRPR